MNIEIIENLCGMISEGGNYYVKKGNLQYNIHTYNDMCE